MRNAAAMNARPQSELRYKRLVDAQGDAIFRRDLPAGSLYANEGFFRMSFLDPKRAIGFPLPRKCIRKVARLFSASFAALEAGPRPARYDQHVRTALWAIVRIAWEDYAIRDSMASPLAEVQSVGRDVTERKGAGRGA